MGTDKALLEVDGRPMAATVAAALRAGGADDVCCIGGDLIGLVTLGLAVVADDQPGGGPLTAIATALREADRRGADLVVVAACDLPKLTGDTVAAVVSALLDRSAETAWAAPVLPDGSVPLLLALRVAEARERVSELLAAGRRAVRDLRDGTAGVLVPGLSAASLADADRPDDLRKR
jgi:molybdopterin-guanine dinucleotide biosynthesis protein A